MRHLHELFGNEVLQVGNQGSSQRTHLGHGGFFDVEVAFVLSQISLLMRGIQHAPTAGRPAQRVRQTLKHGVTAFTAQAMPA